MSRTTASPNEFLERVIDTVAKREIAAQEERPGAAYRVSVLGTFAGLMGVKSKQAVSYWIAAGGVPRKHAQRLREVVEKAGLSLTEVDFKRLVPDAARRGENEALRQTVEAVRSRGVPAVELANCMGMSYWQLHRCLTTLGGLPLERLPDLIDALRELGMPLSPEGLADCVCSPHRGEATRAIQIYLAQPVKPAREPQPLKWWLPGHKTSSRDKASSRGR